LGGLEISSETVARDREMIGLEARTSGKRVIPNNLCKVPSPLIDVGEIGGTEKFSDVSESGYAHRRDQASSATGESAGKTWINLRIAQDCVRVSDKRIRSAIGDLHVSEMEIEKSGRAEGVIKAGDVLLRIDSRSVIETSGAASTYPRLVRTGVAEEHRVRGIKVFIHTPTVLVYAGVPGTKIIAVKPVYQRKGRRKHVLRIGDSTGIQQICRNHVVREWFTDKPGPGGIGTGRERVVELVYYFAAASVITDAASEAALA
jgi:hypothetical protein